MEIGGNDMILPGPVTKDDRDVLFWRVLRQWPDARWESDDGTTGGQLSLVWSQPNAAPWDEGEVEFFINQSSDPDGPYIAVLPLGDDLTLVGDNDHIPLAEDIFRAITVMLASRTS
jgi:hypothetical protein